jgi:hypothetical protein
MMATATRFNAAKYLEMVTPRDGEPELQLVDIPAHTGGMYGPDAVHSWRKRHDEEGGAGPIALVAPDKVIPRGGAAPELVWLASSVDDWLFKTLRRDPVTRQVQKPRPTGKSRADAVAVQWTDPVPAAGPRGLAQHGSPAPVNTQPAEPRAHTRIRALMLAQYHGLISVYIGAPNALTTLTKRLRYWYLPAGMQVTDLKRGEDPFALEAEEVMPHIYGLAVPQGLAEVFAYREGLPGWRPPAPRPPVSR